MSDIHRLLSERVEALEDGVDVPRVSGEVENGVELDARRDLVVRADEAAKVAFFLPGAHGLALDESIGLVAREPGLDEREQQALAEEEAAARLEIPEHPLRKDPQA